MTRRPRASLYVRLSKQADDTNVSLEGMIKDVRALAQRLDMEEVALHVDDGKSGGRRDRDEFQEWLNDARTGAADALLTFHTDRLTREGLNVAASILDVVEGKDPNTGRVVHKPVRLVDCNGLDSNDGDAFRFRFVIQAEVGRSERERIRQRQRNRDRLLRQAGRWPGGPPPYGYRIVDNPNGEGKTLDVDPDEAKVIREAAEAVLAGDPLTRVVRRLNHAGVRPRRADAWSRVTLRQVLTGEAVLGRLSRRGQPVRDSEGNILQPWPGILPLSTVSALRAALAVKTPDPRKGGRRPARLLSGILTCHACGRFLQVARRTPTPKAPKQAEVTYRCQTRADGGICERPVSVSALAIEEHVEGRFLSAIGHLPYYVERTVVSGLEELAAVEEDIKLTLADMATKADADTFVRLQRLQARREELSAIEPGRRTELVDTGLTMAQHWAESMVDDRRELLATALEDGVLVLLPGRRGPRGFDPNRLIWRWREEPDDGE